jgi:hypothetical protein
MNSKRCAAGLCRQDKIEETIKNTKEKENVK